MKTEAGRLWLVNHGGYYHPEHINLFVHLFRQRSNNLPLTEIPPADLPSTSATPNMWEGPKQAPPEPNVLFVNANQISFYKLGDDNAKKLVEDEIRTRQGEWAVEILRKEYRS